MKEREIDEKILKESCSEFKALIEKNLLAGVLKSEIIYAALAAIVEMVDKENEYDFVRDSLMEIIFVSEIEICSIH